jgi:glycerophosphoryl diester phosphodiesterase
MSAQVIGRISDPLRYHPWQEHYMPKSITVLQSYLAAWNFRDVFIPVYLLLRLMAYAVIAPLLGIAITLAVSLSDQTALTDHDIPRFILSPAGAVVTLAVIGLLLLGEVLSLAVMIGVLHTGQPSFMGALREVFVAVARRLQPFFGFVLHLVVRVLLICLPFVIAGWLVIKRYLTEFDINYYLSARPPEFYIAVGIITLILLGLLLLLMSRLSLWAVSLHFVLFADTAPRAAFRASSEVMHGKRMTMIKDMALWLALRLVLSVGITLLFAALIGRVPLNSEAGLQTALTIILLLTGLWALIGLCLGALSLGAMAKLLDARFEQTGIRTVPPAAGMRLVVTPARAVLAVLILGSLGLVAGGALLDRIKTKDRIEIIAHRGAAGLRPENTLASVEKSIEDGADWIEIDVQETADDQVVVVHDSDFMKVAHNPLKVWDATMEDLNEIDIGSWFSPDYADQRTPLLSDVLVIAKDRAKVLIELKYYGHDIDLEARVARIVEKYQMQDQVAIMSLKYEGIRKMRTLRPDWSSGVLAASAVGSVAGLEGDFIAISTGFASPKLIRQAQAAGKSVYVWTVNDPLSMSGMISKGVDGIITDEPAMARSVLEVRAGLSTAERLMLWMSDALGLKLNTKKYSDDQP